MVSTSSRKVAFLAYETPHFPWGGLAAVLARLPGYLQEVSGMECVVVAPYHFRLDAAAHDPLLPQGAAPGASPTAALVGEVAVPLDGTEVPVEVYCVFRPERWRWCWYYLKPRPAGMLDPPLFGGARHAYDVGRTPGEISELLLRDALFFGAAAVRALCVIDPAATWSLLLQDWETAPALLAAQSLGRQSCKVERGFVTLHNCYDSRALPHDLQRVEIDPGCCPGDTVLRRTLGVAEWPVFTVSQQFAAEMVADPLQAQVLAPHLADVLRSRISGVDNGLFAALAVDRQALADAACGNPEPLGRWKEERRRRAMEALVQDLPAGMPVWGDAAQFVAGAGEVPWFAFAGRDDSRQKGYDVAVAAVRRLLPAEARFIFLPMPGDEGLAGLGFLRRLAEEHPGHVLALPFRFPEGYFPILQGAAFGVMPSFYEPFGAANEFYLNGTLGIGRATGGILQQIVPLRSAASFSAAVEARARRWYDSAADPTGLLYRERDGIESATRDLDAINAAQYDVVGPGDDRVAERGTYQLFREMVEELALALRDGISLWRDRKGEYFRMLADGVRHVERTFSWERSAADLARHLR